MKKNQAYGMESLRNSSSKQVKVYIIIMIFLLSSLFNSCKNAVEVSPSPTSLVGTFVFNNTTTAEAAVTGIFQELSASSLNGSGTSGLTDYTSISGLSADEFTLYSGNTNSVLSQAYANALTNTTSITFWKNLYNIVYLSNNAIAGLKSSTGINASVKEQLLGECYFVRAFCDFYLVNIYGSIPNITDLNYLNDQFISKSPVNVIYMQMISDLKLAQSDLSSNFLSPTGVVTTERTLPNQDAATALLARVYLYYGNLTGDASNYANAESEATLVINNTVNASLVPDLNNVFLANSNEALWELQPIQAGYNTADGWTYILTNGPTTSSSGSPMYLSNQLLDTFESGDLRKVNWINNFGQYFYMYKYKVKLSNSETEYTMVLRLAELYLIRAEARVQQGEANGVTDLNTIRNRAGLANYSGSSDKSSLLTAILHENQVEFCGEYGHRWLDLKRSGNINTVMSVVTPLKGGTWKSTAQLFPIPESEIQIDYNLTQNPGY